MAADEVEASIAGGGSARRASSANFSRGRTPASALIVRSRLARAAGARPDQVRSPTRYGPSSDNTMTDRRGAEAMMPSRSSFELTGIVRG